MQTPIKALHSLWWALVYRCWSKTSWLPSCSISRIHIHQRRSKQLLATAWTSSKDAHTREDWEIQRKAWRQDRHGPLPGFELRKCWIPKIKGPTSLQTSDDFKAHPLPVASNENKHREKRWLVTSATWKNSRTHQLSKLDWLDDLPRMPLDRLTPKESVDGYKQCQRETIRSQHRSVAETYDDLAHLNKWSYPQWTTHAFSHRGNESSDWITPEWRSKWSPIIRIQRHCTTSCMCPLNQITANF